VRARPGRLGLRCLTVCWGCADKACAWLTWAAAALRCAALRCAALRCAALGVIGGV
jgi:hypothetical protein